MHSGSRDWQAPDICPSVIRGARRFLHPGRHVCLGCDRFPGLTCRRRHVCRIERRDRGDTSSRATDGSHNRAGPVSWGTRATGFAVFQQGSGGVGDVRNVGSSTKIGDEHREVFRGRMAESLTQIGVVHVVFDDAECKCGSRRTITASPTGSRGIRDARALRLVGLGFINARAPIPETTVDGHRGA